MNALPHDGEQLVSFAKGPWIASEYYKDPQPDKFHDGWLVTGDVAKIDLQQYVMIADRSRSDKVRWGMDIVSGFRESYRGHARGGTGSRGG